MSGATDITRLVRLTSSNALVVEEENDTASALRLFLDPAEFDDAVQAVCLISDAYWYRHITMNAKVRAKAHIDFGRRRSALDKIALQYAWTLIACWTGACAADQAAPTAVGAGGPGATSGAATTTGSGQTGSGPTGTGTTGGPAGSGSSAGCDAELAPDDLISDFESGSAEVFKAGGRSGSWFTFNDGSGMQTPVRTPSGPLSADMGGACNSQYAMHTTGTGFTVWGAGIGATLTPGAGDAGGKASYDASGYRGIAFWAKVASPTSVRVSVPDGNTAAEGGVCLDTTDRTSARRCGDYFGADLQIGTTWQAYTFEFATAAQSTWGLLVPTGLDKAHIFAFHAQVRGTPSAPANFELWLDNVRFVK
jgi:hypothetical protein